MNQRINAAAKALCAHFSKSIGTEEDNWVKYQKIFITDAKTALDAADKVDADVVKSYASVREAGLIKRVEDQDRVLAEYRRQHGVLGAKHD